MLGFLGPGRHEFEWNGRDGSDVPVPAAVYFARLEACGAVRVLKVALAR